MRQPGIVAKGLRRNNRMHQSVGYGRHMHRRQLCVVGHNRNEQAACDASAKRFQVDGIENCGFDIFANSAHTHQMNLCFAQLRIKLLALVPFTFERQVAHATAFRSGTKIK